VDGLGLARQLLLKAQEVSECVISSRGCSACRFRWSPCGTSLAIRPAG